MRKYDLISILSAETSREVTRNEESWKKYLNTASRLYKYPFKDQLLIYAQRPDATACGSLDFHNKQNPQRNSNSLERARKNANQYLQIPQYGICYS